MLHDGRSHREYFKHAYVYQYSLCWLQTMSINGVDFVSTDKGFRAELIVLDLHRNAFRLMRGLRREDYRR